MESNSTRKTYKLLDNVLPGLADLDNLGRHRFVAIHLKAGVNADLFNETYILPRLRASHHAVATAVRLMKGATPSQESVDNRIAELCDELNRKKSNGHTGGSIGYLILPFSASIMIPPGPKEKQSIFDWQYVVAAGSEHYIIEALTVRRFARIELAADQETHLPAATLLPILKSVEPLQPGPRDLRIKIEVPQMQGGAYFSAYLLYLLERELGFRPRIVGDDQLLGFPQTWWDEHIKKWDQSAIEARRLFIPEDDRPSYNRDLFIEYAPLPANTPRT